MDEVYRDHRIAVSQKNGRWTARVTHVRGTLVPINASVRDVDGNDACLERARGEIDRYLAFLAAGDRGGFA